MQSIKSSETVAAIRRILEQARPLLTQPIRADSFLLEVAQQTASHRFLGNCTGALYQRQTVFLSAILEGYFKRRPSDLRLLDWGCGKGHISYLLRQRGFAVTACDRAGGPGDSALSQETPILVRQRISVVPLVDDVQMPLEPASQDCVVSFGVLEHVPHDAESLRELRRVLVTGGIAYISFLPYVSSWTQALSHFAGHRYHDRLYTHASLKRLAQQTGFALIDSWHAQLFPKNSVPLRLDPILEPLDRALCRYTPLRFLATNLEAVLIAV